MAAYNAERYVERAVNDILQQTFRDFELVIVEDGSNDATLEILRRLAATDERIVLLENARNLGLPASLNKGLRQCRADLVARADADDEYMVDRLETQFSFMERRPEIGLLSCAVQKIDEQGSERSVTRFPLDDGTIRMRELFVNCFSHPGVMFRKELVLNVGGYNETFNKSQDVDLWERLRRTTKAANLKKPLVRYRHHNAQAGRNRKPEDNSRSLSVRQRALTHYLGRDVGVDEARSMVRLFHPNGDYRLTRQDYDQGLAGLTQVMGIARSRETLRTRLYFRRQLGNALMRHAREQGRKSQFQRILLKQALLTHPFAAIESTLVFARGRAGKTLRSFARKLTSARSTARRIA